MNIINRSLTTGVFPDSIKKAVVVTPDITKCSNKIKYFFNSADGSTFSTCVPGDNVMDTAELINNELKCIN